MIGSLFDNCQSTKHFVTIVSPTFQVVSLNELSELFGTSVIDHIGNISMKLTFGVLLPKKNEISVSLHTG